MCLALALLAAPGTARAAAPAARGDAGARARTIVADPRYQKRLPGGDGEKDGEPGRPPSRRSGDVAPTDSEPGLRLPAAPESLGPIIELFVYLLLAFGVVFLGYLLVQRFRRGWGGWAGPAPATDEPPAAPKPDRPARAAAPRDDAERLAAEGRWAEALHALLLQAIRLLAARLPAPPPPSSTSREVLRLVPLSGEARQAFAGLVQAVELSLFGGAPVGPEEYAENRERYRAVAGGVR